MTNGTSQGLFIVVAIVIFGIFVGMSYVVFGDTLTPALSNIFMESIDRAVIPVEYGNVTIENGFAFDEKTQTIVAGNMRDSEVIIPSQINGIDVLYIGAYAFNSDRYVGYTNLVEGNIKKLVIPNTVLGIGDRAFDGQQITDLDLGNSVKKIGWATFNDLDVTKLNLPESLVFIDRNSFSNAQLTELTFSSKLDFIGGSAFASKVLKEVRVPKNADIHKDAFTNFPVNIIRE